MGPCFANEKELNEQISKRPDFRRGATPLGRWLSAGLLSTVALGSAINSWAAGADVRVAKGHILVQPRAGLSAAEFDRSLAPHGAKAIG